MKPRNFPLRKLLRKVRAEKRRPSAREIEAARATRTKKRRGGRTD